MADSWGAKVPLSGPNRGQMVQLLDGEGSPDMEEDYADVSMVWPCEPECLCLLPVLWAWLGWPGIGVQVEEEIRAELLDFRQATGDLGTPGEVRMRQRRAGRTIETRLPP